MGTSGRKPLPAKMADPVEMHRSKETISQRLEIEEQLETRAKLSCPKKLSPTAQKEWRRVMKLYKAMGASILSDLDITALGMYCEATAIYDEARKTWAEHQKVVVANPNAQRIIDKCIETMSKQAKIVVQFSELLCLTPVGRARMGVAGVRPRESELDKLLSGREG